MSELNSVYPNILAKYLKYLQYLQNDETKDITFAFEESNITIKAHKLILVTVSPVFQTMFNGSFTEKHTAIIHDIEPEIFQKLINVLYMQPIDIQSVEEAVELANVAEMYNIEDLKIMASNFMMEHCSFKNCFYLCEKGKLFGLKDVVQKCHSLFNFNVADSVAPLKIFASEHSIDEEVFCEFLQLNRSPDSALYQILEFFVMTEKLKTYKKALGKIQFLTMSVEEVVLAELLSESERLAIISNIEAKNGVTEPVLKMPDYLSSTCDERVVINFFSYKYFWITVLLMAPVEELKVTFKRVAAIKNLFNSQDIEIIKNAFQQKLNGEELDDIKDLYIVEHIISECKLLHWCDTIRHGDKRVTLFGKDDYGLVSLEFSCDGQFIEFNLYKK